MTEGVDKRCRTCRCAALRARNARWTSLALLGGRLSLRLRPRLDDIVEGVRVRAAVCSRVDDGRSGEDEERQNKTTYKRDPPKSASAESLFA